MMIEDLNRLRDSKIKYPESFDYKQYFDGFETEDSMPGSHLEKLVVNGGRERFLKQESPFSEIRKLYEEDATNKLLVENLSEKQKNLKKQINEMQSDMKRKSKKTLKKKNNKKEHEKHSFITV